MTCEADWLAGARRESMCLGPEKMLNRPWITGKRTVSTQHTPCVCVYYWSTYYKAVRVCVGGLVEEKYLKLSRGRVGEHGAWVIISIYIVLPTDSKARKAWGRGGGRTVHHIYKINFARKS